LLPVLKKLKWNKILRNIFNSKRKRFKINIIIETIATPPAKESSPWKRRLGSVGEALLDLTGFGQVNWIKAYSKGRLGPREGLLKLLVAEQTFLTLASKLLPLCFSTNYISQGNLVTPFLTVMAYGAFQGFERKVLEYFSAEQKTAGVS